MGNLSPRSEVSVPSRGNRVIDCTWAFFARVNGIVSIPSRGNRVIDTAIITMQAIAATQVSVPSRGNRVIDQTLKTRNRRNQNEVSVPSRGNRVIDSIDNASSAC